MKLTEDQVMVAKGMKEHGTSVRQLARQLEVTEGALRYQLKKVDEGGPEGRADQATALDGYEEAVREAIHSGSASLDVTAREASKAPAVLVGPATSAGGGASL